MPTLLMRVRAPMMSWGDSPNFTVRGSRTEPTKSAIIGLLCAALGRPRDKPIADLTALKLGVKVEREGILLCDYHTVEGAIRFGGKEGGTTITQRYFVADANYLVGLEGDRALLETLDSALASPHWQLYFGRKSFVPSTPVRVLNGILDLDLEEALYNHPTRSNGVHRYVLEVAHSLDLRRDVPLGWLKRQFGTRYVETKYRKESEM
jgi:CRISPR system Cascade subunit CasD